ncbi:hypothetical protein BKG71_19315 [Mycobacteroides chelonae]|nr:hypothetical protein BKG71_19315 [Mycobacteroides chelonae]
MEDYMENYASGLTIGIVRQLRNQGMNFAEIAREFGVTRQAVSYLWRKYDGSQTTRQKVAAELPFNVPDQFNRAAPLQRLRDHAEFMMTLDDPQLREDQRKRLRSFYKKLRDDNVVVEYDPNIPSDPGVCKTGGFAYRPREPRDGDLLIRENEYTNLTEYGENELWHFPPHEP